MTPAPVMTTRGGGEGRCVPGNNTDTCILSERVSPEVYVFEPAKSNAVKSLAVVKRPSLCYDCPNMKTCLNHKTLLTLLLVLGFAWIARADEMTALGLVKEADRYVGEQSK